MIGDVGGHDVVEVSWPADRRRFANGLREFPMFRTTRKRFRRILIVAFVGVVVGFVSRSWVGFWLDVELLVVTVGLYWFIRFAHLRQTIDGTLRWTIGDAGIRVHGYLTTEVPWTEVACWYVAGGHLIVGVRRHSGGRSKALGGLGAPVEAFSDAQMARTRSMLEEHAGPESV